MFTLISGLSNIGNGVLKSLSKQKVKVEKKIIRCIKDCSGNSMIYKEFNVNSKLPNAKRDAQRFLKESDGSI